MEKRIHRLVEYISLLQDKGLLSEINVDYANLEKQVKLISFDSTEVKSYTLFICKGRQFSPEYLRDAVKRGAFAYVSEKEYDTSIADVPRIIVTDIRKAMAYIADFYYNQVWRQLYLTGITGTKGKSTTTYFVRGILDEYLKNNKKQKSAIISGIDNYDGIINEESHLTTPESFVLHQHFNNAVKSEIEYLTMEVSSQGLKYDRTLGISFDVGCFLNIAEDHISDIEHSDFDDYLNSKLLLFKQCKTACVNLNSDHIEKVLSAAKEGAERVITFGLMPGADIYGYNIMVNRNDITFNVKSDSFDREFKIAMHGLFNVQNALAAIAVAYALNIPLEYIASGLKRTQVSGRMEIYTNKERNLNVIVDYAHNKMSFESLFTSMQKEFPGKKISIVFGCPGKKALGRRRELGEIAGRYSSKVFITEEDAGEEPLMNICEEIASHVKKHDCDCEIIVDREKAIKQAIETADDETIVLITGKGRETRQKRGKAYVKTRSDVDTVMGILSDNIIE